MKNKMSIPLQNRVKYMKILYDIRHSVEEGNKQTIKLIDDLIQDVSQAGFQFNVNVKHNYTPEFPESYIFSTRGTEILPNKKDNVKKHIIKKTQKFEELVGTGKKNK